MNIKDKTVVLGVTGGIAAFKALELARLLVKRGARVRPVMTRAAREFVTPLSLSTLAKSPVLTGLFNSGVPGDQGGAERINHIELAQGADLVLVAPATANIIGKIASGIADDLLTTIVMATTAPVLLAPAMNTRMWENPVVKGNVEKLRSLGYGIVGPDEGELACGDEGPGRLAPVEVILEAAFERLGEKDLEGEKVLITAGATREAIDPVRFVSNASSGKMGYSLARAARRRGAEVVLVSGHSALERPPAIEFVGVTTAVEMLEACRRYYRQSTVVIMAAAVSDFRPSKKHPAKIKKTDGLFTIELEPSADILKEMGSEKDGKFLVGFALETDGLVDNAKKKLKEKNLDMVVANSPDVISDDSSQVTIIDAKGRVEKLPTLDKDVVADRILDEVLRLKKGIEA